MDPYGAFEDTDPPPDASETELRQRKRIVLWYNVIRQARFEVMGPEKKWHEQLTTRLERKLDRHHQRTLSKPARKEQVRHMLSRLFRAR